MNIDVEKIIRENIDNTVHMSLATVSGDAPWVCEVHFAYDDDLNLYWRSLTSRRHSQEIAKNPKVAGNIVKQHAPDEYPQAIYFEGTAELLGPGAAQQKAFECIKQQLGRGDEILEEAQRPDGHQFYKITVKNWYAFGKFNGQPGQKYTLEWNGVQSS
jgi:nitroimidazol reductase NimA-like FMN-containing flavoprotein (pyridoxamine 5'-phosphate oxidase superfamily)